MQVLAVLHTMVWVAPPMMVSVELVTLGSVALPMMVLVDPATQVWVVLVIQVLGVAQTVPESVAVAGNERLLILSLRSKCDHTYKICVKR